MLPPDWEVQRVLNLYRTQTVRTFSRYPDIYRIEETSP